MVCSACGYETRIGNRYCGMCGTPLPHRPLTAPGAQGTLSLTRVPLESAKPADRQPVAPPLEGASAPSAPNRTGVLIEMPSAEPRTTEALRSEKEIGLQQKPPATADVPFAPDMVPEVPLDDYVKSFRYVPPADPKEITMRGEAQLLQPDALAVTDPPATAPNETAAAENLSSISPTEDIQQRLGLEDSPAGDERRDRPRFLDFSESPPPPEELVAPGSTIVGPSFLGLGGAPQVAAEAADEAEPSKPSRWRGRTWFAVTVLLAVAVLGALAWRSQLNQTNSGPVEVIKMKFRSMRHGNNQSTQSTGSADTNHSTPEVQIEDQPKPQDQNPAVNLNGQGSASASNLPSASDASGGTNPANSPQNTTGAIANQVPTGQESALPSQSSSLNGTQSATGQKLVQTKPTPSGNTLKTATTPDLLSKAPGPPKSKPEAAPGDDSQAAIKRVVPGEEELAKANDASDSAATAAWLWKATAKGNPDAPVRLADLYVKGDGVPRSCEQALVLLKTAAAKENARARNRLAALYNSGICVQRNRVEAYRWLNSALAADPNSRWAQQNRDLIWQQMTPEERAAAQQHR